MFLRRSNDEKKWRRRRWSQVATLNHERALYGKVCRQREREREREHCSTDKLIPSVNFNALQSRRWERIVSSQLRNLAEPFTLFPLFPVLFIVIMHESMLYAWCTSPDAGNAVQLSWLLHRVNETHPDESWFSIQFSIFESVFIRELNVDGRLFWSIIRMRIGLVIIAEFQFCNTKDDGIYYIIAE